jgi:hypothetical protein
VALGDAPSHPLTTFSLQGRTQAGIAVSMPHPQNAHLRRLGGIKPVEAAAGPMGGRYATAQCSQLAGSRVEPEARGLEPWLSQCRRSGSDAQAAALAGDGLEAEFRRGVRTPGAYRPRTGLAAVCRSVGRPVGRPAA